MPPVNVNSKTVSQPSDDSTVIDSPALRNLLVQKPTDALDWMSSRIAPVSLSSISIDDQGKVVILDKAFATAVSKAMANPVSGAVPSPDTACGDISCGDHKCT